MRGADLVSEYERLQPACAPFAELGRARLSELLEGEGFELAVPLQVRVKSLPSLAAKIDRKGEAYEALLDIPDLVGFRMIVAYRRDLERACQIVEEAFRVSERSVAASALPPNQFGYTSIHLLVHPPYEWQDAERERLDSELTGEVQVRTLAQHLWAHASHDLQYKLEEDIPYELRRAVNRSAALLELVDLEIERVLVERDEFRNVTTAIATSSELSPANVARLLDALWPQAHRHVREEYGFLVEELNDRRIQDCNELARIIRKHRPHVLDYAARYARRFLRNIEKHGVVEGRLKVRRPARHSTSSGISADMISRLREGVFYSHVALTATALAVEFDGRDLEAELLD